MSCDGASFSLSSNTATGMKLVRNQEASMPSVAGYEHERGLHDPTTTASYLL